MNLPETRYPITSPLQKGSLVSRLKLAWSLVLGKPVMYRVGIVDGNVYYPDTVNVSRIHITDSVIRHLDDEGYPTKYNQMF